MSATGLTDKRARVLVEAIVATGLVRRLVMNGNWFSEDFLEEARSALGAAGVEVSLEEDNDADMADGEDDADADEDDPCNSLWEPEEGEDEGGDEEEGDKGEAGEAGAAVEALADALEGGAKLA